MLPFGEGGIIGGSMLGLGRALGETIAVYLIISPVSSINTHIPNTHIPQTGSNSVSSLIALRYGDASSMGLSALMAAAWRCSPSRSSSTSPHSTVVARSRFGAESDV